MDIKLNFAKSLKKVLNFLGRVRKGVSPTPTKVSSRKEKNFQYPEKFSTWLEMSLEDLIRAENSMYMRVDMARWFGWDDDNKICEVCLGGAALMYRKYLDYGYPNTQLKELQEKLSEDWIPTQVQCLNMIRDPKYIFRALDLYLMKEHVSYSVGCVPSETVKENIEEIEEDYDELLEDWGFGNVQYSTHHFLNDSQGEYFKEYLMDVIDFLKKWGY